MMLETQRCERCGETIVLDFEEHAFDESLFAYHVWCMEETKREELESIREDIAIEEKREGGES